MPESKVCNVIHLKPIECMLSEEIRNDMDNDLYKSYLNKNLLISATDGSNYTKIRMKDHPFESDWFLNDSIDFNRRG